MSESTSFDSAKVEVACSLPSRLRGLLGRGEYCEVLLLAPCKDIHTFGMRFAIDVAFVSADGVVLESHRGVGARRRLKCRGAYATLERMASSRSWLEEGDQVELKQLLKEAAEEKRRSVK